MQGFSDTETEFWKDLDKPISEACLAKPKKNLEKQIAKEKNKLKVPHYQDKFVRLVDQARTAAKETYNNMLKVALHKQAIVYQEQVKELNKQHREEMNDLVKKFWKLDDTLQTRDIQISDLQRVFIIKEEEITYNRLESTYNEPVVQEIQDKNALQDKLALQLQLGVMKELLGVYEKDIEKLKDSLEDAGKALKKQRKIFEKEKFELQDQIKKLNVEYCKRIDEVNDRYVYFKHDMKTELDVRALINCRQHEIISGLKQELVSAKTVLDTPRLLFKYNSKFSKRHRVAQSVPMKPLRKYRQDPSYHKLKFDSKATLSTRDTPIFTLTPDINYPSSILQSLSEND